MPHRDEALLDALLREVAAERVARRDDGDHALFKYRPTLVAARARSDAAREARSIVSHVPTATVVCRPTRKDQALEINRIAPRDERWLAFLALDGALTDARLWEAVRRRIDERATRIAGTDAP